MLLAFQILLFVFIILFGLFAIGVEDKEHRLQCALLTAVGIASMTVTFLI